MKLTTIFKLWLITSLVSGFVAIGCVDDDKKDKEDAGPSTDSQLGTGPGMATDTAVTIPSTGSDGTGTPSEQPTGSDGTGSETPSGGTDTGMPSAGTGATDGTNGTAGTDEPATETPDTDTVMGTGEDSDTVVDGDAGTDETASDTEVPSDTETGNPQASLSDLETINLDSVDPLIVTVLDSGSEAYEDAAVAYWVTHNPLGDLESPMSIHSKPTNDSGVSQVSLPPNTYDIVLDLFPTPLESNALFADASDLSCSDTTVTAGCNGFDGKNIPVIPTVFSVTKPAGRHQVNLVATRLTFEVNIDTDTKLNDVTIELYRTDENGLPIGDTMLGSAVKTLVYTHDSEDQPLNSIFDAVVEVFEGNYRAIVRANGVEDYDTLEAVDVHPYLTPVITVTPGGTQTVSVPLNTEGNKVQLTIRDTEENAITEEKTVMVVDCATGWTVNSGPTDTSDGTTDINAGNFSNVVAIVDSSAGFHFENLANTGSQTLTQRYINGSIIQTAGVVSDTQVRFTQNFPSCAAAAFIVAPVLDDDPADTNDTDKKGDIPSDSIIIYGTSGDGITYTISVDYLEDYYYMSSQSVTVMNNQDPDTQNINVEPGGVIAGTITNKIGGAPLSEVSVRAGIDGTETESDGKYELHLPVGTYDMFVGDGALTKDISVVANQTTTKNFQRGPYNGQVISASNNSGVDGAMLFGTAGTTTDGDGFFTLQFYEGLNWVCVNPNSSLEGYNVEYQCFYDIMITPDDL